MSKVHRLTLYFLFHLLSSCFCHYYPVEGNSNEQISRNPRRVAHCRVSSLVMVCRRSFAVKTNLVAIDQLRVSNGILMKS